jgi:NTE family protein
MGGALALHYAMTGNVSRSIEMVREVSARNDKVVDITWFPRPALLHGKKSKEVARKTWGEITLAEFEKPAAAVAADLVRGDRFVFDRGLGSIAARATTAIPGIYPPIPHEGRLLVDGALVNRIPLDLLDERGCGLKMAVNVIPSPEHKNTTGCTDWQLMNKRFNEFLGLRHVIASSWALLAWWQGTTEAQSADIIFEPRTEKQSGYDFSSLDEMIEAGRIAAREKLAVVEKSVASLLKPGAP